MAYLLLKLKQNNNNIIILDLPADVLVIILHTLNCVWSNVVLSSGLILLSFLICILRLAVLISVSPHVTDSRIALCMKIYCSCKYTNIHAHLCLSYMIPLYKHTKVCTIIMRWCLILLMVPAMSTTFSFLICSRTLSMQMKVPVRPTPALHQN